MPPGRYCPGAFSGAFAGEGGGDHGSPGLHGELVDLSYPFNKDTIYWPTATEFTLTQVAEGETEGGYYYAATTSRQGSTAARIWMRPCIFARGGDTADEVAPERLVGDADVVDVSEPALATAIT